MAYVEERNGKQIVSCYYIYLYTDDVSVIPLIEQDTPDAEAVKALANIIAMLHEKGIVHHDLNLSNVLYHRANGKLELSLIDINRMTPTGHVERKYTNCSTKKLHTYALYHQERLFPC